MVTEALTMSMKMISRISAKAAFRKNNLVKKSIIF